MVCTVSPMGMARENIDLVRGPVEASQQVLFPGRDRRIHSCHGIPGNP